MAQRALKKVLEMKAWGDCYRLRRIRRNRSRGSKSEKGAYETDLLERQLRRLLGTTLPALLTISETPSS